MQTKIHTYTSLEPMLKVNAFIVEAEKELVIVDTTLTMSDSKRLQQKAVDLGKPIAGIILTHGHPDHVAGTYNLVSQHDLPIYALASVKKVIELDNDFGEVINTDVQFKAIRKLSGYKEIYNSYH